MPFVSRTQITSQPTMILVGLVLRLLVLKRYFPLLHSFLSVLIFQVTIDVVKTLRCIVYDIGGQRSERKKWPKIFNNIGIVIYMAYAFLIKIIEKEVLIITVHWMNTTWSWKKTRKKIAFMSLWRFGKNWQNPLTLKMLNLFSYSTNVIFLRKRSKSNH